MPEAFFTVDGDSYVPGAMTRGPWGAAMGGQIVGGLLGWGIERSGIDPDFQPARFTVDLLRPVLMEPVQIRTSVQREGRRIKLVDGTLVQNGKTVARAAALFLRRGDHPDGQVWSAPVADAAASDRLRRLPGGHAVSHLGIRGHRRGGSPGIAAGEWEQDALPEVRVGADVSPDGARPPPHTVYSAWRSSAISRVRSRIGAPADCATSTPTTPSPRADCPTANTSGWRPRATTATAGVATGAATLFDRHGPFGTSSALALAQPADAFQPSFR